MRFTYLLPCLPRSTQRDRCRADVENEHGTREQVSELCKPGEGMCNYLDSRDQKEKLHDGSSVFRTVRKLSGQVFGVTESLVAQAWGHAVARARRQYEKDCEKSRKKPDAAFLVDLRFHDLRHEATSRLFERGVFDSMEVASITGHKTLQMLKRYTHLRAEDLAKKLG